jgi:phenylpyruvate tautomerase PptA (4-oxalocrotonate tautomerase family)
MHLKVWRFERGVPGCSRLPQRENPNMTMINVNYPVGRISVEQRRPLAEALTDTVLVPEIGQYCPPAREGFQVHFTERPADYMAIGGKLLSDQPEPSPTWWVSFQVIDE